MNVDEVLTYFKHNGANVCRALEVTNAAFSKWRKKNKIPYGHQKHLELYSKGVLKASKDE